MTEERKAMFTTDREAVRELILDAARNIPAQGRMRELVMYSLENPGKMIRSRIMLLLAGKYSPACRDELLCCAAAIEMIHTSSLILDDIIDDAALRRGKPTVQAVYGKPIALCGGDTLMVTGINLLLERGYPRRAAQTIDIIRNACSGEMLQHTQKKETDVPEEAYFDALRGKTAYAFRGACAMSAEITGRTEEQCGAAARFGECIGTMFQVRDDLMDWTVDEKRLGKPANLDFAEGIYTLPAIFTFRKEGYGDRLRELAGKTVLSPEETEEARRIVRESGGIEYTKEVLRRFGREAAMLAETLPGNDAEDIRETVTALQEP